jgi:GntR family transcriptional regulator, transcriptional repressor for pyruvate dehydrogenase complex
VRNTLICRDPSLYNRLTCPQASFNVLGASMACVTGRMRAAVVALVPKKNTLSSQVTRYLLDLLVREQFKPGDLAPSEVQICRDLHVSRGIVREAFRSLATLGILEIESGKSPRVQPLNASVLAQIIEFAMRAAHLNAPQVLQLRRAVEIEAARLAAQHGTRAQFDQLRECVFEMRQAGIDHRRMIAADVTLHTLLAQATGNPLFAMMLLGLRGPLEDSIAQGLKSRRTRDELLQIPALHDSIVQRVCARDGDGAAKAMAHHFDLSVAAILAAGVRSQPRIPLRQPRP